MVQSLERKILTLHYINKITPSPLRGVIEKAPIRAGAIEVETERHRKNTVLIK